MAQNWHCTKGDDDPAFVVVSWPETGAVDTPCIAHWVGMCCAVAAEVGWTPPPVPEVATEPVTEQPAESTDVDATPDSGPPDLQVARVVKRGQTRRRSKPERAAMHAHLREADQAADQG